ncbi:hypothetical protein F5Y12DRAFT_747485 [Xylaria sp. FL1777]|nr:hypothetical protein F5Y12DRAFT_747485 [Xylaria sp. FL1777]
MSRSLTLKKIDGKPGEVYYPLQLNHNPKPVAGPGELLIRLHAAALNHRDHFQRQHLYPGISFEHPLLADGCGVVEAAGPDTKTGAASLVGKRVMLTPSRGWDSALEGPERPFFTIGAHTSTDCGAAQDYVVVPEDEVEPAPDYLSTAEAAALPLVGLTAWRALVTKSNNALPGRNILVTGIGGGVALAALQFAVALGCNVYVTSGSPAKLERATRELGAKGGVSYRDADWHAQLAALLPKSRPYLDAVVDGAGGDVMARVVRLLKPGGVVSSYGMTLAPRMDWLMTAVMKNVELRGSTMGSRKEFSDMVAFVREHRIHPVVSRVVKGLDNMKEIEELYEEIREGRQFGKLIIEIAPDDKESAKL